jgi:nucleoside-diphosphate-sugar epimerase
MKRILVTGANGFIGKHLVRFLLSNSYEVRACVRKGSNTKNLPENTEAVFISNLDGCTPWDEVVQGAHSVIHLAAKVHVMKAVGKDAETEYHQANADATLKLAEECVRKGIRRFIFVSSVKAMGEITRQGESFNESTACQPEDGYGRSKLDAELRLKRVVSEKGLEVIILRLPLVYGPGVRANFLRLMRLVDSRLPLPVASIKNQRSMLYVGNLLGAILLALTNKEAPGETFLISDGEDVSTPELMRRIALSMGKSAIMLPFPTKALKVIARISGQSSSLDRLINSLRVDCSKLRNALNWTPSFSMDQGLRETAKWYREIKR